MLEAYRRYGQLLANLVLAAVVLATFAVEFARHILPYFTEDVLFTFRSDNFYSYTSGIVRRALPGEIIYRLDLLTGIGPQIYSVLMLSTWLFFLAIVTHHFRRTAGAAEQIFIYLSSFYIIHRIDAEIFILLPFIPMLFMRGSAAPYVTLVTIVVAGLIREVAFIFYAPVFLGFLFARGRGVTAATALTIAGLAAFFLLYSPVSTYRLEFEYWPERGEAGLTSTLLYRFTNMGLPQVVGMHVRNILKAGPIILPGLIFFFGYAAMLMKRRAASPFLILVFLGTVCVFYLLTFDHGRYFYFLFMMMVLMTTERGREYFDRTRLPVIPLDWFGRFVGRAGERARTLTALLFALSPAGFYVLTYSIWPRAVRVTLRAAGIE